MWPFRKKTPIEEEEVETIKELVTLMKAEENMRLVRDLLNRQIKMETLCAGDIPHSTSVYGIYWKKIIPPLHKAKLYIIQSREKNENIRNIIHKFHLLTNSSSQEQIDNQLKQLNTLYDKIITPLNRLKDNAGENLTLSLSFSKNPNHKTFTGYDRDAPKLVKQFKSKYFYENAEKIWQEIEALIKRIKQILDLEEHLKNT